MDVVEDGIVLFRFPFTYDAVPAPVTMPVAGMLSVLLPVVMIPLVNVSVLVPIAIFEFSVRPFELLMVTLLNVCPPVTFVE